MPLGVRDHADDSDLLGPSPVRHNVDNACAIRTHRDSPRRWSIPTDKGGRNDSAH